MLYTIIPEEDLFDDYQEEQAGAVMDVEVNGTSVQVEPLGAYSGRVVRVISSNPQDFLNPQFRPGNILHWG